MRYFGKPKMAFLGLIICKLFSYFISLEIIAELRKLEGKILASALTFLCELVVSFKNYLEHVSYCLYVNYILKHPIATVMLLIFCVSACQVVNVSKIFLI